MMRLGILNGHGEMAKLARQDSGFCSALVGRSPYRVAWILEYEYSGVAGMV